MFQTTADSALRGAAAVTGGLALRELRPEHRLELRRDLAEALARRRALGSIGATAAASDRTGPLDPGSAARLGHSSDASGASTPSVSLPVDGGRVAGATAACPLAATASRHLPAALATTLDAPSLGDEVLRDLRLLVQVVEVRRRGQASCRGRRGGHAELAVPHRPERRPRRRARRELLVLGLLLVDVVEPDRLDLLEVDGGAVRPLCDLDALVSASTATATATTAPTPTPAAVFPDLSARVRLADLGGPELPDDPADLELLGGPELPDDPGGLGDRLVHADHLGRGCRCGRDPRWTRRLGELLSGQRDEPTAHGRGHLHLHLLLGRDHGHGLRPSASAGGRRHLDARLPGGAPRRDPRL